MSTMSQWGEHLSNKENWSYAHNVSRELLSKSQRIAMAQSQDGSFWEVDSDCQQNSLELVRYKKRRGLKSMIGALLKLRKTREKEESYAQISQEQLCFKVFKNWRKLTKHSVNLRTEAEMMEERKYYNLVRRSFHQWKDMVMRPAIQLLEKKRIIFGAFKVACSIELSLRVRRLRVQEYLGKRRGQGFLSTLKSQHKLMLERTEKATFFKKNRLKEVTFRSLCQDYGEKQKQRLESQKYLLAALFSKRRLLRKTVSAFKSQNEDKMSFDHF